MTRSTLFLASLMLFFPSLLLAASPSVAIDTRWSHLRGVNFFSSDAANAAEMWRHFDPVRVDRELGWMEQLGFNSVRIWLSEQAWREDPEVFTRSLALALDLSDKHRLSVLLVLFDSCGIEPRGDAVEMSIGEAYEHFLRSPSLSDQQKQFTRSRYAEFAKGRGRYILVPVAKDTPPDIIFWQNWTPNPGLRRLGPENWPEFDAYADAVMKTAVRSTGGIAFDLMNEPSTLMDLPTGVSYTQAKDRVYAFVAHIATYMHNKYPTAARTIGCSSLEEMKSLAQYQTVLSIHSYLLGDELAKNLKAAAEIAQQNSKGLILSEGLANTDDWLKAYGEESISTDEGQLRHYQRTLPIILHSGIGWYAWGGIAGRMFTPSTDLIYPGGYLRPAAAYLQRELAATPAQ
ncbi:MAG: hypothetical protein LAO30_25830 [Acidobacteriia bacterium]|nr:hypothetical protein [Terriglobia bacterium]